MSKQHTKPCSECPWRRVSFPGWLGDKIPPEGWVQCAHSDSAIPCHKNLNHECAGAAIFRDNVFKVPRDPAVLQLPADRKLVFASSEEFILHHRKFGKTSPEITAKWKKQKKKLSS